MTDYHLAPGHLLGHRGELVELCCALLQLGHVLATPHHHCDGLLSRTELLFQVVLTHLLYSLSRAELPSTHPQGWTLGTPTLLSLLCGFSRDDSHTSENETIQAVGLFPG